MPLPLPFSETLSTERRTRVKICGLTRRGDALAAVDLGADALGLVFYAASPRAVSIAQAQEIVRGLPPHRDVVASSSILPPATLAHPCASQVPWAQDAQERPPHLTVVGLFVNATAPEIRAVLDNVRIDLLQFHGDEPPQDCVGYGVPYIKAVRMREGVDLFEIEKMYSSASGLLLDSYQDGVAGGTGVAFDWARVPTGLAKPIILAGGLTPDNVAEAIRQVRPYAVDVSGGVESAKGIKDAAKMAAFIQGVKNANSDQHSSDD